LQTDPWEGVGAKYPVGTRFKGKVTNVTDYGAFVELEPGVEGLVHVSEMSWVKKNVHPNKIVAPGQEVDVMVLEVDSNKRRISLGLKQCLDNPWKAFADTHKAGALLEGEIKNITEFGLFIGLPGDIDGMVHLSDLSWDKSGEEVVKDYAKGQTIKVKVLDIDAEKERVSLGVKQLTGDPMESPTAPKKGSIVTVTVTEVGDKGIDVQLADGAHVFIRRGDLARDRNDQRPERFGKGEKVDAMVTSIDKAGRKIGLSIKAREVAEEKEAVEQYGSSDSGASLGDILGAALTRARGEKKEKAPAKTKAKAKGKAKDKDEGEKEGEEA
jgi:small subunit ribosomal protein S1